MNYKKVKTHIIKKTLSLFASTALLTLTLISSAQSTVCPVLTSTDYLADTSTLGYSTSYNKSSLDVSNMNPLTTECSALPALTNAQPGFNCLYDGKPLCQNITAADYVIPAENILSTESPIPRYNCHDLVDLPLCELISKYQLIDSKKNCALKCSEISTDVTQQVRGQDYAVHNRDCVRLCDEVDAERITNPSLPNSISCVARSCHQLDWDRDPITQATTDPVAPITGSNGNCNLLPCNSLYPYELLDTSSKIEDDINDGRTFKQYCNNEIDNLDNILKCYDFSKPQLQFTVRDNMCQIHKCKASCSTYVSQTDENGDGQIDSYDNNDALNAMDSPTGTKSAGYEAIYSFHEYACLGIEDVSICQPTICLPVVDRQYRCTVDGNGITGTDEDIIPNPNCGTSADESDCTDHFCEKTIDCNLGANDSEPECLIPNDNSVGTRDDGDLESWFNRPKPLDKAVVLEGDFTIIDPKLDARLCYDESTFEDRAADWNSKAFQQQDWGWDSKIVIPSVCALGVCTPEIVIDLGYFHSSLQPDATRAGGMCKFDESDNFGFRGVNYSYLCYREGDGNQTLTGSVLQNLAEHTAYYKGYVKTTFKEEEGATHELDICLRFRNALRPDDGYSETCGSRECAVTCMGFAGGCSMQNCGYDVCSTLKVEESAPSACAMSDLFFGATFDELLKEGFDNYVGLNVDLAENSTVGMVRDDEGNLVETTENNAETYAEYHEDQYDTLVGHFDNAGGPCITYVDSDLRIRVQKINNYICAFLDKKGVTAYDDNVVENPIQFADGSEILIDDNGIEYCLDGKVSNGSCNAFDTTKDPWSLEVWRTIKLTPSVSIPYILNNQPSTANFRGFIDRQGRVNLEQNCIKATMRTAPLDFYNLATAVNSSKLFLPPVYIANARTYQGGSISLPTNVEHLYGSTSFHYPEIEVRFGDSTQLLNLDIGAEGDEDVVTTISTTLNGASYDEELFIKKEYNVTGDQPILCLYQKIISPSGTYIPSYQIGCVDRKKPEIDNSILALIDPNLPDQKIIITSASSNTYDNSSIKLQYLGGFGANNIDDNCNSLTGDDDCTQILELTNPNVASSNCDDVVEKYQVCALREECSQLNNECMVNEINIHNAKINGESTTSLLVTRDWCNNHLIAICNNKLGLSTDPSASIYETNPSGVVRDVNAYGWFNELCFTSGANTSSFNDSLNRVIAHDPAGITNNVKGKCLINLLSPYLIDDNPNTNCEDGGLAPNCLCVKYVEGIELNIGEVSRLETEREAGLCIDMPVPEKCPEINHNPIPNPLNNNSDPDYVSWSLYNVASTSYGTVYQNDVHDSHELRTNSGSHAEFPVSMMGMTDVEGQCRGFWKNTSSASGVQASPIRSCENINGLASWSALPINNECSRYSCPEIYTAGIYDNGSYQGGYGITEGAQEKGLSQGYALWPYHLQTTDFAETVIANSCLIGFKQSGSAPYDNNADNEIDEYPGGTLPTRYCNQLGNWQTTQDNCERIECSPVNVPSNYDTTSSIDARHLLLPENYYIETVPDTSGNDSAPSFNHDAGNPDPLHQFDDYSYTGRYNKDQASGLISDVQWDYWLKSGGAFFFEKTLSSRSNTAIEDSSKTIGYCNHELGFFQAGSLNPELECDHLGNWVVKNQCVTRCDVVVAGVESEDENNGYSSWVATDVPMTDTLVVENNLKQVSGSCLTGAESTQFSTNLLPYPYPPLRNRDGENYNIYYPTSEYYDYIVGNVSLESHLNISQFTNDPALANSIPAEVKTDSRFHFLDSFDSVEKWSIPYESLPAGSSATASAPEPTRLCKWAKMETGFTTNYWHPADSKCITKCPSGNYDPRLDVGITQHQIYDSTEATKTKKFYISWPEVTLGQWAFKTNTGTINGMDASHFSNDPVANPDGRNNGKYIVARKCGLDGKWEDPQPHCATNGGYITGSNAVYNSESISNSSTLEVASQDVATGSCSPAPPYYPTGQDTGSPQPVSSYTCEYHDANQNIDQVFFDYKEGDPCEAYCQATDDQTFQNAYNNSGSQYVKSGEYLALTCSSGYGKALGSSGSDSTCGRTATDRISTNPSVLCNANGTWSSGVTNNCYECRSCTSSSVAISKDSRVESDQSYIDANTTTINYHNNGNCSDINKECSITSCISTCSNDSFFTRGHEDRVRIKTYEKKSCRRNCSSGGGKCKRTTTLNGAMTIKCVDGAWWGITNSGGSEIDCNSI